MPRHHRAGRASISGVALALALIFSLFAAAPAQAAGGILRGTLTGPDGAGWEYFQVDVYRANGSGGWEHAIPPRRIMSWETGLPVGDFEIALPAGSYRACFTALTYEYAENVGRRCWDGGYDVQGGTDIVVAEGGTTTITPRLPREARLRGRITGAGGAGISAYVSPYRRAPDGTWTAIFGNQSNADGTFELTDLDPGTYRFCLADVPREYIPECWDNVATVADAQELAVPPGSAPAIYFRLVRRANISGTVTRPAGSTATISVTAYRSSNQQLQAIGWSATEADGSYRITGLDAGTYRVCADGYDVIRACWRHASQATDATDIVLATAQGRGSINMSPTQAGFVTGTLPDVYLGAEGYPSVTAWRQVVGGWEAAVSGEAFPTGFGNDWQYSIGSLPTGTYVVCVSHAEPEFVTAFPHTCNGNSPTPEGGVPFEVVAGATTSGIDIATSQAGEIRGRVNGAPGVRVDLFTATGRRAMSRTGDAEGDYRFRELPSGTYYVAFHRTTAMSALAAEWWHNRTDGLGIAGATPVIVNANVVTGISASLDVGGVITGRLVDDTGSPVAGCIVQARARDGSLAVRTAVTGTDGTFAIGGLSTASYLVLVTQRCSGAPTGMFHDAESPTQTSARGQDADAIAVVRGATTALPADLRTGVPPIIGTSPPSISGTPAVGSTLTAERGTWQPESGLTFAYRWYADGVRVRVTGAAARTLLLTPDLEGARIRVHVVVAARGWQSAVGKSAAAGPVAP